MKKINLDKLAELVIKKTGFVFKKIIAQGFNYDRAKKRNIIIDGLYKGSPAVLKLYDDWRITDEPLALKEFNKINKSKILKAPRLYEYNIISPTQGWLIMEKLPEGGIFFSVPLKENQKEEFLKIFFEYRRNFPKKPWRKLTLAEKLPAGEFHIYRIMRWLEMATQMESQRTLNNQSPVLNARSFIPFFLNSIEFIKKEFLNRKMVFCHGHFKPHEIYAASNNLFYLTDFAHVKMYPEGYELAFIAWADWMKNDLVYKRGFKEFSLGLSKWLEILIKAAKILNIKNYERLMKASFLERILGTILADLTATNRPVGELKRAVSFLQKFALLNILD